MMHRPPCLTLIFMYSLLAGQTSFPCVPVASDSLICCVYCVYGPPTSVMHEHVVHDGIHKFPQQIM